MENFKILFVGSKDIGYYCLNELVKKKEKIVGVVCRHDDPYKGQWYKSVSELALKNKLNVFKPADINDAAFIKEIENLQPDILICAQYPKIFKRNLIQVPSLGCINLHFAPLPKYRGCFPIAWAIINGENEFGVTMHFIDPGVDSGDIIAQEFFSIKDSDSGRDLYDRCTKKGLGLFKKTFPLVKSGKMPRSKQDNALAIKHSREAPFNKIINWNWEAKKVYNFIRSLYFPPFECTFTFYKGSKIHIPKSKIVDNEDYRDKECGEIVEIMKDGFLVKAFDKCLFIPEIQADDRVVSASEYLLSNNIKVGSKLGS